MIMLHNSSTINNQRIQRPYLKRESKYLTLDAFSDVLALKYEKWAREEIMIILRGQFW